MKKSKRILSLLLSLALALSLVCVPTFAADSNPIPDTITTTKIDGVEYLEFDSADDMVWLRSHIAAGGDTGSYCTHNIILTADIDMTGSNGDNLGIGAPQSGYGFSGIFDGNGHTVSNLYVAGAQPRALLFNLAQNATVKNVKVTGSVDGNRFTGGVIGRALGSLTLENVVVDAALTLIDGASNSVGGLVGQVGSGQTTGGEKISIKNCAALGTYAGTTTSTAAANPVGGLVGHIYSGFDVTIENCYVAADLSSQNGGAVGGLIASQAASGITVTNCYYPDSVSSAIGVDSGSGTVDAKAVSADYMKSAEFVTALGAGFKAGEDGYPIPVTIISAAIGGTISAFAALDETAKTVDYGTAGDALGLPGTLSATVDGEETFVSVTWSSAPEYSATTPGEYTFTAAVDAEAFTLAEGVELPTVTVTVAARNEITGVIAPEDIDVAYATAESDIGLPATIQVNINDAAETTELAVTWSSSPAYSATTPGAYTFTAALVDTTYTLADGVSLPVITVTVAQPTAENAAQITSYTALGSYETNQLVPKGTDVADLNRPWTLTVVLGDATEATTLSGVTWECGDYNGDAEGTYTFTPVLPEGYAWGEDVNIPTLTVEVRVPDYSIATADEFFDFMAASTSANTYLSGKLVVLTADIDLSTATKSPVYDVSFYGTLDGQGHVISGYQLGTSTRLFNYLGRSGNADNAIVRNVGFEDGVLRYGIFAYLYGTVENVYVKDNAFSTSDSSLLANTSYGTVVDCYAIGMSYRSSAANGHAGALARQTQAGAQFINCYVVYDVDTTTGLIGAIVGSIQGDTKQVNTYSADGGIFTFTSGAQSGTVVDRASMATPEFVAALNAGDPNGMWILSDGENGYLPRLKWEGTASTRTTTPDLYPVAYYMIDSDKSADLLDIAVAPLAEAGTTVTATVGVDNLNNIPTGITVTTASGTVLSDDAISVVSTANSGRTVTYSFVMPAEAVTIVASQGVADYPLQIDTADDWLAFAATVNGGHDYTGETVTINKAISLAGYDAADYRITKVFNGTLAGTSITSIYSYCGITDISIDAPGEDNVGLFSVIGPDAVVKYFRVAGTVAGKNNVGLLAGVLEGTLNNVGVYGLSTASGEENVGGAIGLVRAGAAVDTMPLYRCAVTGTDHVGAAIGFVAGSGETTTAIQTVYNFMNDKVATSTITASAGAAGALIGGAEYADISYVYNNAYYTITGTVAGGVAGSLSHSTLTDAMALSTVTGTAQAGGIVGEAAASTITNAVAYNAVTADDCAGGIAGTADGDTALTNVFALNPSVSAAGETGSAGAVAGNAQVTDASAAYAWGAMPVTGAADASLAGTALTAKQIMVNTAVTFANLDSGKWTYSTSQAPYLGFAVSPSYILNALEPIYEIYTADDLTYLATLVNAGYSYAGKTVTLMNDIDLSEITGWVPIGKNTTYYFAGTFDGQGHTLSNLAMGDQPGYSFAGMFGIVLGSGIQNLTLDHFTYKTDGTSAQYIGILSSFCFASNLSGITIKNSEINITGSTMGVGTVAANASITSTVSNINVEDCAVKLVSTLTGTSFYISAGGAFGGAFSSMSLKQVSVTGLTMDITHHGLAEVGGIVGHASAAITYQDCTAEGEITVAAPVVGGAANSAVGGLLGKAAAGITAESCRVNVDISGTNIAAAGGLLGYSVGTARLDGCSYTGSISTDQSYVGGLVGNAYSGTAAISGNIVNARLTGTTYVGGIVGGSYTATTTLTGNMVLGQVTATDETGSAGGLAGYANNATYAAKQSYLNNAVLLESVTGGADYTGLLIPAAATAANENNAVLSTTATNASETAAATFVAPTAVIDAGSVLTATAYTGNLNYDDSTLSFEDGALPYLNEKIATPDYLLAGLTYAVTLVPSKTDVILGEEFTVDVVVTGEEFAGWDVTVTYDPALFIYDGETEEAGTIRLKSTSDGNYTADEGEDSVSVTIATLTFTAVSSPDDPAEGALGVTARIVKSGDAQSSDGVIAKPVGASVAVDSTKYVVTFDPDEIDASTVAEAGQDYTGKVLDPTSKSVTVEFADGTTKDYAVNANGTFTIPADDVTGPMTLTASKVEVILYTDYVGGYTLIVVYGEAAGYTYNGTALFRTPYYDEDTENTADKAFATFVYDLEDALSAADVLAAVTATPDDAAEEIEASYDVNFSGYILIGDAQAARDSYNKVNVDDAELARVFLRADVNADHTVDMTDVNLILNVL